MPDAWCMPGQLRFLPWQHRIVRVESTTVFIVKAGGWKEKPIVLSKNESSEQILNTLLGTMRQKVCS